MNTYQPLELGQPGRTACPDTFEPASTRECPGCRELILQTSNAAIVLQFGHGSNGAISWGVEEPVLSATGTIVRQFDAFRVRNYTAGQAAQILATPVPAGA